ncbi:MAG: gamma-glutamyltransferase [Candidatus Aminicenantes bacterium]|nr:MAG: gamma-glutamyltransferase [Candidatus Aminicenantes bacterium]
MRNKNIYFVLSAFLAAAAFMTSCDAQGEGQSEVVPAKITIGMVSSAHPIATEAGLQILTGEGNAFDAAVAVASTLNVVEPMNSGIGGYGTILVYDAKKEKIRFLDSSGKIPAAVDSDVFRKPNPDYKKNRYGPKAISTPGNVNAWEAMSKSYGKLRWKELFQPAIDAAEQGYTLDARVARSIRYSYENFPEHAKGIYGINGLALGAGEKLIQKDLAASLRLIAEEGAKAVYGGKIGTAMDKAVQKAGGFLSLDDLVNDRAEWWDPIHIPYRDCEVYTTSPPSTAFPSLIRLGIMSRSDVGTLGHNSFAMLLRFIETTKHAFWCRLSYAGDPEINPPPLDKLLDEDYWKEQAGSVLMDEVRPFLYPGWDKEKEQHTTHFVVADAEGNIVSATQTLGGGFGSRIMPEGTGIWLNNSLSFCTFEPKGGPMDAHPGRRKLSGDCPTIIVKNGKPWAALGTPGGHTIGQTVPQMVMNLIDFRMDIREAISAPRVSFAEPDRIFLEEGISPEVIEKLRAVGHNIKVLAKPGGLGNAHGLTIVYGKDGKPIKFHGAADPRGAGLAKGLIK